MTTIFNFPFDDLPDNHPRRIEAAEDEVLRYNPDSGIPDHLSAAADLDSDARTAANEILLSCGFSVPPLISELVDIEKSQLLTLAVDKKCLRSSQEFITALLGHLGTGVVALIRVVFFSTDTFTENTDLLALIERVINLDKAHPFDPNFRRLVPHLRKADTLNQALLRTQRILIRTFSSPFAQTQETMPAFSVFDETGNAKPFFVRRNLTSEEALHPILKSVEYTQKSRINRMPLPSVPSKFSSTTDVPIGTTSVIHSLDMFRRAFSVFTTNLLSKVPLGRSKAIVAGGAVSACLLPWPQPIVELYTHEKRMHEILLKLLWKLPLEIANIVITYSRILQSCTNRTDSALFEHLCGDLSPYSGSDIDVFFVCPFGATDVDAAMDLFPAVHSLIVKNRAAAAPLVRRFITKKKTPNHWIFRDIDETDPNYDWFIQTKAEIEKIEAEDEEYETILERFDEGKGNFDERDENGWNDLVQEGLAARLKLLWTVRTTNSVTITGCHPVRHVQLMLPVVRCPEQVVYPFDLDCVSVFYDGSNVYATPRSLRSFNTRTNFVDRISLQDRSRCVRILKYCTRGFSTVAFEVCRHFPRCDVVASRLLRETIVRGFPELIAENSKATQVFDPDMEDNDEWIPLRFDPKKGGDTMEPPGEIIGMDYTTAPLLYGPQMSNSDLITQIKTFEKLSTFPTLRDRKPIMLRLRHELTSKPSAFKKEISKTRYETLIPMQFKFLKDGTVGRRVQFATGFHLCYLCKKDVGELSNHSTAAEHHESSDDNSESEKRSHRRIGVCDNCEDLNKRKREEIADLTGKIALVTGGRVKIGNAVVLRLLRNGAFVHVTTRFPLLLLHSLQQQDDSYVWWHRVKVYGLDLRDLNAVTQFCTYLTNSVEKLDIFIQNAAQTIRRPASYYKPIVEAEAALTNSLSENTLENWVKLDGSVDLMIEDEVDAGSSLSMVSTSKSTEFSTSFDGQGVSLSAIRTLLIPDDLKKIDSKKTTIDTDWSLETHAASATDPKDLRPSTTWSQTLPDVPLSEIAEVYVINSIAPTLLLQRLQQLLSSLKYPRPYPTFVVNVSSREGSFSASAKTDLGLGFDGSSGTHPHTNSAKSALNRLTQTIASDWMREGIYVNAVDPGWVSVMGPAKKAETWAEIIPPLSVEDGAARILDPIIGGYNGRGLASGVLFRNFAVSDW
ncbi:hypothetical protein HK100_002148 [Physocladia obscura]|uniref:Uncharacterized protein n=1 Tax=Physocladia obscura TaxID=109957 RepID=A0AAD5XE16_9FUNG|nr:hypothetical protein HK100_002148 [Physocladia obscura]